jgi:hypothetical protein
MARAVAAVTSEDQGRRFAALLWLWPSMWYWPSSIGKESVMLFGLGLVVLGVAGRRGTGELRWMPYLAGLVACFFVRPHVATIVACAAVPASMVIWLRDRGRRSIELAGACVVALAVGAATSVFLEVETVEDLQAVVERRAETTLQGGSRLPGLPSGVDAVPQAVVNMYLRPMIWEVHNPMALAAALEVCVLAGLVWLRRRGLVRSLGALGASRLMPFAVLVLVAYSLMVGLFYGNQGLIARQRTLAMPFLFLLLSFDSGVVPGSGAHARGR